jgi:DNA polymerase III delta prime subunit
MREKRTYNWYVERGLTPPPHVKPKTKGYTRKTWVYYVTNGMEIPPHIVRPTDDKIQALKAKLSGVALPTHNVALPSSLTDMLHAPEPLPSNPMESDAQIKERLRKRFAILQRLTNMLIHKKIDNLIISGPPGLGKSWTVEEEFDKVDPERKTWVSSKGYAKATGLYKLLWEHREGGRVIFDDCDSIFNDPTALNLLKGATDTTRKRTVSWLTESNMVDSQGAPIPRSFEFNGSVAFITNLDFEAMSRRNVPIAEHIKALLSRAHYLDLQIKTVRDYVMRIEMVVEEKGMLQDLTDRQKFDVLDFINAEAANIRPLDLRAALKVASLIKECPDDWQEFARTTVCTQR